MAPITTIVHFKVPAENVERFFEFWQDQIKDEVGRQPGLVDGAFHRCIDPDGPFQFINVAHWESPELLDTALRQAGEEMPQIAKVMGELGVEVSQNNYVEAVRYVATPDPTKPEREAAS
jgi:Antibiotic biosynthesis monooxygenase